MFKRNRALWLFLLPPLIGLLIFYVAPFFGGIYYSVTDGSYKNAFVGLENYINIWHNEMFLLGLRNTLELSLFCAPTVWVLSFLIAMLLNRLRPGGALLRNSILLPYLMPASAMLLVWLLFFDYGGTLNRIIHLLGMERVAWLQGAALRVPVVLLFAWKNLGFAVILFLSALQTVPEPLYEYARLEGANFFQQAFHITLPLVTPTAMLVIIIVWISAFKIFREVYFIGGAYPDESVYTLQNYMNNMYNRLNYQNVTTAAYSFALIVFALFGLLFVLLNRAQRRLK